jgi:hypothetical protein
MTGKRETIDPKALKFTEKAPPAPVMTGERYSPYADIVAQLMKNPGKWATMEGAARKAEKLHKQFPGVERRTAGDDLWLRYVTTDIVTDEIVAQWDDGEVPAALREAVQTAVKDAGQKSEVRDGNALKQTQYFVPAMFDAGNTAFRTYRVTAGE